MDCLCPVTGEMRIYVKWCGICNVTHGGRCCLTAYFILSTLFILQGLKNPSKCGVCGSMETGYSKLNSYTANTILQTISLQMISNMKSPSFHLSVHFSFFRINLFSIKMCYLHPEENWDGLHILILVILTASYEIEKSLKMMVLTPFCVIKVHKLFPLIMSQETQDGSF